MKLENEANRDHNLGILGLNEVFVKVNEVMRFDLLPNKGIFFCFLLTNF